MAIPGTGTLVNALTIAGGSTLGWLVGQRLPKRVTEVVLQVMGLLTVVIGIQMGLTATTAAQSVVVLISLVVGAVTGELLNLEAGLERIGKALEGWVQKRFGPSPITQAFVMSSILYVVGPMAILGSLQDGLQGDPSILLVKSALDGLASIAFTASMGIGVFFSIGPVVVYQGLLTLLGHQLGSVLSQEVVAALTATGGILVMGVGINLLGFMRVRVGNFVPALLLVVLIVALFPVWSL